MTSTTARHAATQRPPSRRLPLIILLSLIGLVLVGLVFVVARDLGLKNGRRDAREQIEREQDITAGPKSLLPS